jgi:hypothetical protein
MLANNMLKLYLYIILVIPVALIAQQSQFKNLSEELDSIRHYDQVYRNQLISYLRFIKMILLYYTSVWKVNAQAGLN